MGKCQNKVSQYIQRGFGGKTVDLPCGSTSVTGDTLICSECEDELTKQYPQGWRSHPGDTCKHGVYIGDPGGRDYLCGKCEDGE